jgi:hypothetical protein
MTFLIGGREYLFEFGDGDKYSYFETLLPSWRRCRSGFEPRRLSPPIWIWVLCSCPRNYREEAL